MFNYVWPIALVVLSNVAYQIWGRMDLCLQSWMASKYSPNCA